MLRLLFIFILTLICSPNLWGKKYKNKKDVLDNYIFIGDFSEQEPRPNKKYAHYFKPPPVYSPLFLKFTPYPRISHSKGEGRDNQMLNRAILLNNQGEFERAIETLLKYTEERGQGPITWKYQFLIGVANFNWGLGDNYHLPYYQFIEQHPDGHHKVMVGLSYAYSSLVDHYEHQLAIIAFYNLIIGLYSEGHYELCYNSVDRLLREFEHTEYHYYFSIIKADLLARNKDFRQAVQVLDHAIRFFGDQGNVAQAFFRVAEIYFYLHSYMLANDVVDMALVIDPNFIYDKPELLWNVAEFKFWQGHYVEARKYYLALQKDYINHFYGRYALIRLGDLEFELKNEKQARYWYNQSVFLHNEHTTGKISKLMLTYIRFLRKPSLKKLSPVDVKLLKDHRAELQAIEDDPDRHPFFRELAAYYILLSQIKEGPIDSNLTKKMKRFIHVYPESQFNTSFRPYFLRVLHEKFEQLYDLGDYKLALSYYEMNYDNLYKTLKDPNMALKVADTYRTFQMYKQANKNLKNALKWKAPAHKLKPYLLRIAEITINNGQFKASENYLKQVLAERKLKFEPEVFDRILRKSAKNYSISRLQERYLVKTSVTDHSKYLPIFLERYGDLKKYPDVVRVADKYLRHLKDQQVKADKASAEKAAKEKVKDKGKEAEEKDEKEEDKKDEKKESSKKENLVVEEEELPQDLLLKTYLVKAEALAKMKKWKSSIGVYEQVFSEIPSELQNVKTLYRYGELLAEVGRKKKRKKVLEDILAIDEQGFLGKLAKLELEDM